MQNKLKQLITNTTPYTADHRNTHIYVNRDETVSSKMIMTLEKRPTRVQSWFNGSADCTPAKHAVNQTRPTNNDSYTLQSTIM